jgi:hypothetical protein
VIIGIFIFTLLIISTPAAACMQSILTEPANEPTECINNPSDTDRVRSFAVSDSKYCFEMKDDKQIDNQYKMRGSVSDADDHRQGNSHTPAGTRGDNSHLNTLQPSADIVTPYIGKGGITADQYKQLEHGSVKVGAEYYADNLIKIGGGESGYTIDTTTGNLLYKGAIIGRTQITEDNYIHNAGEWGQTVSEEEGVRVYAAPAAVWDLDGNILGRLETMGDGHIALIHINPGSARYLEGNETGR